MKPSVSITTTLVPTLLLAAAALWMGLQRQSRIETLRLEQARLSRAIDARFPQAHAHPTRSRRRADPVAEGRRALGELIELATHKDREPPDPVILADLSRRIGAMNATATRDAIGRIQSDESLDADVRRDLFSYFMLQLAESHPGEVIRKTGEMKEQSHTWLGPHTLYDLKREAARRWAEVDPNSAWDRLLGRDPSTAEDQRETEDLRDQILLATARNNPETSMRLATEAGADGSYYLVRASQTSEQKLRSYNALRKHFGKDSEELRNAIKELTLFRGHDRATPFAEATGWLAEAGLTADDLDFVRDPSRFDLCYYVDPVETGKWIDWLLRTFPGDSPGIRINRFFGDNRTKDAAREWLAAQPEETVRRVRPFIDSRR